MTNPRKPDLVLKHDVKGPGGKTIGSIRIGTQWLGDGTRPGRIKLEYVPVNFDGLITVWPTDDAPAD